MKPNRVFASLVVLFCLFVFTGALKAQNVGADATPLGVTREIAMRVGEGYVTDTQIMDARITVLEVIRGAKAWDLVKTSSPSNKPAGTGMEYLVARIKFEFGAKGATGNQTYSIHEEQFVSVSSDGKQYETPSVVYPKPTLSGRLYEGESLEGLIVMLVGAAETTPLMIFGNNYNRTWFRLY